MTSSRDIEKSAKGFILRNIVTIMTHGLALGAGLVVGILL